jgi:hypothetical protein
MRRRWPWILAAVAVLALGGLLWSRYGQDVWLEQAIAFCL